ncbi:MAG: hypothetical protein HYU58_13975 [Proteobacteria bacterium]|nr:hypothetical protein [Pseudomonadota bacterium]
MPQPFNQRPLTKTPKTANEKNELGGWKDGRFIFDSPEAEVTWHQRAYAQGIHPQDWHRGREVDAETAKLVEAGMAGATPPIIAGRMARRASAISTPSNRRPSAPCASAPLPAKRWIRSTPFTAARANCRARTKPPR